MKHLLLRSNCFIFPILTHLGKVGVSYDMKTCLNMKHLLLKINCFIFHLPHFDTFSKDGFLKTSLKMKILLLRSKCIIYQNAFKSITNFDFVFRKFSLNFDLNTENGIMI